MGIFDAAKDAKDKKDAFDDLSDAYDKVYAIGAAIWGLAKTIFDFPEIVAGYYVNLFNGLPDSWQIAIPGPWDFLLGIFLAVMWYPRWRWVVDKVRSIPLPFFIPTILAILMTFGFWQACSHIAGSGLIPFLIFAAITLAINVPGWSAQMAKRFGSGLRGGGKMIGAGAGKVGLLARLIYGAGAGLTAKRAAAKVDMQEFADDFSQKLESVTRHHLRHGLSKAEVKERLTDRVEEASLEATVAQRNVMSDQFKAFAKENLHVVPTTPTTAVSNRGRSRGL